MQPRIGRFRRVEPIEVARRERHDPGAQRRRRHALVLPRLRVHPVRDRDKGEGLAQPFAQRLLVSGVGVGVHQRYRNRARAARFYLPNRLVRRARIHRLEHLAFVIDPLADLEAKLPRNLRCELGRKVEPVEVEPVLPPDGKGVRETPGGDQGNVGEIALDDRVGHEGRAVDQIVHVGPCKIDRTERRNKGRHAIVGTGGNLGDPRVGLPAANGDHVGERAADIDSDLPTSGHDGQTRPRFTVFSKIESSFCISETIIAMSCGVK